MKTINLFSLFLLYSISISAQDPFDSMHNMVEHMRAMSNQMNRSFNALAQEIEDAFNSHPWHIDIQEDKDQVKIIATDLETKEINASFDADNNLLSITGDHGKIIINAHGRNLSLDMRQEVKTEKNAQSMHAAISQYSLGRTVSDDIVSLDKAHIDYKAKQKKLIISIAKKKQKKNIKQIPVNIN